MTSKKKYSLCDLTELESEFSVSKEALLPKRRLLDKSKLSEMCEKNSPNIPHMDQGASEGLVHRQGNRLPERFEIKPAFLKPKNIWDTVKSQRHSTDVEFSKNTGQTGTASNRLIK